MRYLLDANAVIAIQKRNWVVLTRLALHKTQDFGLSSIVLHELYFGAFKSKFIARNLADIERLRFPILDFTPEDARAAGEIRTVLNRAGTPIGPYDTLIAGQALARGLTLITRNTREFARVEGLTVEDWEV